MLNDPVVLVALVGLVRLCDRVISGWIAGRREVLRARIMAALVEAAGPGATVVDGRLDGGYVAVRRPGVTP